MNTIQIIAFIYIALVLMKCVFGQGLNGFIEPFYPIQMIIKFIKWLFRGPIDRTQSDNFPL